MTEIFTLIFDITAGPSGVNLVAVIVYAAIAGLIAAAYLERE